MPGKRYFTDEELEEMGKVTREKVFEQTSIGKQDFLRNVSSKGNRDSS
jgi:hypothetical protein